MKAEDYGRIMRERFERFKNGPALFIAMGSAMSEMGPRIFVKGESVSGKTKKYNTSDGIYISDVSWPTGQTNTGKTGKKIETTYYKSYADARGKAGYPNDVWIFKLTGNLQSDLLNSVGTGSPLPRMEQPYIGVIAVSRTENAEKADGLEERMDDKIFIFNDAEIAVLNKELNNQYNKFMSGDD